MSLALAVKRKSAKRKSKKEDEKCDKEKICEDELREKVRYEAKYLLIDNLCPWNVL